MMLFRAGYPPSTNKSWRPIIKRRKKALPQSGMQAGRERLLGSPPLGYHPALSLTRNARAYKAITAWEIALQKSQSVLYPLQGPLAMSLWVAPPALRRKRDRDNIFKLFFDALTDSGVIHDDTQIIEVHEYTLVPEAEGALYFTLEHAGSDRVPLPAMFKALQGRRG